MSGNDPQSRPFISGWHYTALPNTAPLNNVLGTFQSALDPCPIATPPLGGNVSLNVPESRDTLSSPTPAPGSSHAAWGCLDFSAFETDPLGMGAIGSTDSKGISTTLLPPGDFQGWTTQQPPPSKVWGSLFDPQFIPVPAISNACFLDPISHNFEGNQVWDFDQPLSPAPTLVRDEEFSPLIHGDTHQAGQGIYCQQCNMSFPTQELLASHRRDTQHAPYRCWCGTTFARRDILHRHIRSFQPDVLFPCPHCEKRPRSFKRLDHLTQHFRGYHKMDFGGGIRTQIRTENQQLGSNGGAGGLLEHWGDLVDGGVE